MSDESTPPADSTAGSPAQSRRRTSAFLPIGITFIAVGLAMMLGPASASAWAFLPVGITFLILGLSHDPSSAAADDTGDDEDGDEDDR